MLDIIYCLTDTCFRSCLYSHLQVTVITMTNIFILETSGNSWDRTKHP